MDSAKDDQDLGTYWAPEDRAWLWYNDTIESHAFALRVLTELEPDDARRHGLVQWLLLNKKLSHWKSTRATAEVIYALVHYLKQEGTLASRETVDRRRSATRRTLRLRPGRVHRAATTRSSCRATRSTRRPCPPSSWRRTRQGMAFASATWHFSTEQMPAEADGDLLRCRPVATSAAHHDGDQWVLTPLARARSGRRRPDGGPAVDHAPGTPAEYVHLRDPRGAGFEPEDLTSGYRWDAGLGYYEEIRDSGANFFFDRLPAGPVHLEVPAARQHGRRLQGGTGGAAVHVRAGIRGLFGGAGTARLCQ